MTSVYRYLWRRAWVTSLRLRKLALNALLRCPLAVSFLYLFVIMGPTLVGGLDRILLTYRT